MSDSRLSKAMADLDESEALKIIREKIGNHVKPETIINELQEGMSLFSEKYKNGNYFIGDLILSGEIFNQSMKLLEPQMAGRENITGKKVKIVLGTVKGDIHNLGKDILAVLLKASGFEVYDLGINVMPEVFIEKLKETNANLLGLSGLITPSFESMKETIEAIKKAGLRNNVKIIIGGGIVDDMVREYTGADAFSTDAMKGIELCKKMTGVK